MKTNLKMIDLFAGIGGIRIAFEENGVECVASSEIDKYACKTYYENFHEYPLGDITLINSDELPDFDIITAGFPCQPFSLGGLRKGFNDTRGTLFFEVARLIRDCKPKAFFLENVEGLANHDNGQTIRTIENVLSELGYTFKWKIMNASDYGTPQNRKRWYCVGFRNDLKICFDDETDDYQHCFFFPQKSELRFTVKDILDLSNPSDYLVSEACAKNINSYLEAFKQSKRYNEAEALLANEIRPSRCNFRCDGIAPCLTAKMGTGGNNVPVYVDKMRKLTERECLKLMGFPEWFVIEKNTMHSYKQIGNSVVVTVIEQLASEMVRVLKSV